MRLLNTRDLTLKEFYTDIPKYAILSHTWGEDEVTFQDIQNLEAAKCKHGWAEIKITNPDQYDCLNWIGTMLSRGTNEYGFIWIWIDSCCIDKSSSADLSENLNSMYRFYADAAICYVYLPDALSEEDPRDVKSGFRRSKWFTRGWTLQELIAPSHITFVDGSWRDIGSRHSLCDAISAITSITSGTPPKLFEDEDRDVTKYSIAQRMSWAAFRETTRPEDRAYSLMGLFDICMPPIYGEGGAKAFMRLQQEIIKISDDRSIFAWA
ncbi:HET-domain-containing protein, partial [Dendrothele bispora CBS 962.96]